LERLTLERQRLQEGVHQLLSKVLEHKHAAQVAQREDALRLDTVQSVQSNALLRGRGMLSGAFGAGARAAGGFSMAQQYSPCAYARYHALH
jgi:hypothetical protein